MGRVLIDYIINEDLNLCIFLNEKIRALGQAQWLIPVISALWELRQVDHEVRSSRPAWPIYGETLSTKNTKMSWVGGVLL